MIANKVTQMIGHLMSGPFSADATPIALDLGSALVGRWVFAGVFALLIVWLVLIPRDRIGHAERVPPWWRNIRVWAIAVASVQIVVYLMWG